MQQEILPEIDPASCTGCNQCVVACPTGALALVAGKAVLANPDRCQYDGNCELVCPTGAIQVPYAILFGDDQAKER